jgi:hypothetical protein
MLSESKHVRHHALVAETPISTTGGTGRVVDQECVSVDQGDICLTTSSGIVSLLPTTSDGFGTSVRDSLTATLEVAEYQAVLREGVSMSNQNGEDGCSDVRCSNGKDPVVHTDHDDESNINITTRRSGRIHERKMHRSKHSLV